ncbi:MAG: GGDEF domain-containing protein [Pseudomonadota bacterium]|jgi:diguanylate cyclase (GGDEF)-like protein
MSVAMLRNTQSEIAHEVIESVVHLTEQRDELTLLRSLQNSIHEMLPEVQIAMACLVADEKGNWVDDTACPLPTPMFALSAGLRAEVVALDSERSIREHGEGGQTYLIASLGTQDDRRKAVLIRQPEWNPTDLRIARGMLNIYSNFARVLFDSERDTLTGLYNRKKLEQKLGELLAARMRGAHRQRDESTTDYLAVFDIDHFKRVNDTYGHLMGDEVLLIFAGLVRNTLRDVDWVFRYGGEEFVALIKGVPADTISIILERVRAKIQDHAFPQVGQVTVSIGFTAIAEQTLPPYVFEEADKALYYAKEQGRNQVCDYAALVSSGALSREEHAGGSIELF